MRDLVQLALPSKKINPRAERSGPRSERSFSDALQIKPGKSRAAGKEAPANAPAPPAATFRIRIGSHGLTSGLPVSTALRSELIQGFTADDTTVEPALDTDDLENMAEEIPSDEKSPDAVMPEIALPTERDVSEAEPEMLEDGPEVLERELKLLEAAHAVPEAEVTVIAPAQAPVPIKGHDVEAPIVAASLRLEAGPKSARAQIDNTSEPDAAEASPAPRMAAAETAKAADRPALAPPPANAITKASPPAADGLVRQPAAPAAANNDVATAETEEAKPPANPERTAASRSAAPTSIGESRSDAPRIPMSVRVVEAQSFPAPPQTPPPSVSVTSAIAVAPDWMSFVQNPETAALASSPGAAPIKSLTIQLHPAELGVVTAKLRFDGEQLTIELQVERTEAYDRLSTDRETMLKAVRALGIEVDKITIQQPQAPNAANARSENSSAFNGGGREPGFAAPGGSGGREDGGPNNPRGGTARDEAAGQHSAAAHGNQNPDGRGLYI